ncbi:F-box only protein 5 [Lepeophtheirus salmonis]|uniref:Fbox only protein 5like [Monodelphis domestica] n=1 Tax=Lepeophtheirus salmonis TaxID=72036 RepID=A0A0K2T8X8_LEPSM|nr:F-box only protein 5-like [Lepeophtheirus salmonis]
MYGTSTPAGSSSHDKLRLSRLEWSLEGDSGVDLSVSTLSTDVSSDTSGVSSGCSSVEYRRRRSFVSGRARYSWWIGRERLDILRLFQDMNAAHLFALLGSYLRGPDFVAMSFVSKTWNSIVAHYFHIPKWNYLISLKSDYENSGYEEHHLQRSTPRKAMSNVSNLVASSSSTSSFGVQRRVPLTASTPLPTSPSKIRHRLFTEEASKLSPGECLQSCPRCTNPSRVILSECRATCSRISCGFEFCTKCMCSAHVGTQSVCRTPTKSSGKISNKSIVATKKSRRRLKRL